ncbi:hypothetical protein [Bacillus cereus group sp. BfR-BA-01310]|uniref:hypothetical protein n=1 Tax=Bacillus cereus group sp. BfR-BA-01310 TaxID=2920287 RepID=UPI001F5A1666|nr:hypothetical protein [Bacillus cereus group sp. BfR-BA-01310]
MIVEFEGFEINEYIIGSNCSIADLKKKYQSIKQDDLSYNEIVTLFCVKNNYQRISKVYLKGFLSDIVIDLDTDYIYFPRR